MKISVWAILFCTGFFSGGMILNNSYPERPDFVYQFDELETKRKNGQKSYLPFLNVSSLHCGIYSLAAGGTDGQQPHEEDEIYYVESGKAKIKIDGKDYDVKPGSIVFVPAKIPHHFHSIESDLKTLVFFSKGPIAEQQKKK